MVKRLGVKAEVRGRGLIYGVAFDDAALAGQVSQACFEAGMVIETAGMEDQVLKLLPSLTISDEDLVLGLDTIEKSLAAVLKKSGRQHQHGEASRPDARTPPNPTKPGDNT